MSFLERYFHLAENGTSVRQECLGGVATFLAMSYLIFVVPAMLKDAGLPPESATAATLWITILSTLFMGLWARFPVALAPGLAITAFFAYYICGPAGYTWQTGLGAVFISGVVFLLLTVTRLRQMLIDAVPKDLKYAIVAGIGAFIAFIGLKNCGIVVADPKTFVTLGDLREPATLLAAIGVFVIGALVARAVPGAILIGIAALTVTGILLGLAPAPDLAMLLPSLPPLPTETFMQMDLQGTLHHGLLSIILTLTMADLFDGMGTLIGVAGKAGLMREDGHIPNLDRALTTDSLATMASATLGATSSVCYVESAAGVAAGGRTGLTAVVVAGLFFLTLFFAPLAGLVPGFATAPVLVMVGAMMMQDVTRINFADFSVALPAFLTIVAMPLTFNIATGFGVGFIAWVAVRGLCGRWREISPVMCVMVLCFALNFALRH